MICNEAQHNLRLTEDVHDTVMLCATVADMTAQLQSTLWNQPRPIILTSGTLAVGSDFHRFREEAGLLEDSRVTESVSLLPDMRITDDLREVEAFIRSVKGPDHFREGGR